MANKKVKWHPATQEYVFVKQDDSKPGKLIVGTFGDANIVQEFDVGSSSIGGGDTVQSLTQTYTSSSGLLTTTLTTDESFFIASSVIASVSGGEIISSLVYDQSSHILELDTNLSSFSTEIHAGTTINSLSFNTDNSTLTLATDEGNFTAIIPGGGTGSGDANVSITPTNDTPTNATIADVNNSNEYISFEPNGDAHNMLVHWNNVNNYSYQAYYTSKDYVDAQYNTLYDQIGVLNTYVDNLQDVPVAYYSGEDEVLSSLGVVLASKDYVDDAIANLDISSLDFVKGQSFKFATGGDAKQLVSVVIPELSDQPTNSALMFTLHLYQEGSGTLVGEWNVVYNFHNATGSIQCISNNLPSSSFSMSVATFGNDGSNNIMTIPIKTGGTYATTFVKIDNFTMVDWVNPGKSIEYNYSVNNTNDTTFAYQLTFPLSATVNYSYQHIAYLMDSSNNDENFEIGFQWIDNNDSADINTLKTYLTQASAQQNFRTLPASILNWSGDGQIYAGIRLRDSDNNIVLEPQDNSSTSSVVISSVDIIKTIQLSPVAGGSSGDTSRLAVASSLSAVYSNGTLGISITSDNGVTKNAVVDIGTGPATYQHLMTMHVVLPQGDVNAGNQIWTEDSSAYFNDYITFANYLAGLPSSTMACYGSSTIPDIAPTHNVDATYVDGTSSYTLLFTTHVGNNQYTSPLDIPDGTYTGNTEWSNGSDICSMSTAIIFSGSSVGAYFNVNGQTTGMSWNRYAFSADFTDAFTAGDNYEGDITAVTLNSDNNLVWTIINSDGDEVTWTQTIQAGTYVDNVSTTPQSITTYDQLNGKPFNENHIQLENRIKRAQSRADSAHSLASAAEAQATAADALAAQLELAIYSPIPIPVIAPLGGLQPQIDALDATVTTIAGDVGTLNADVQALQANKLETITAMPGAW